MSQKSYSKMNKLSAQSQDAQNTVLNLFTDVPNSSSLFSKEQITIKKQNILQLPPFDEQNHEKQVKISLCKSLDKNQATYKSGASIKSKKKTCKHKKSKIVENNTLKQQRVLNICKNIFKKLRINNIYRQALSQEQLYKFQKEEDLNGIELSEMFRNCWDFFGSVVMLMMFFSQSFAFVFPQLQSHFSLKIILGIGALFFLGEIILNMFMIKRCRGQKVTILRQIVWDYMTGQFILDASILIFSFMLLMKEDMQFVNGLICLFILKVSNLINKLDRLEKMIFKNFYYQKYWSLFKIMLFNLTFAHIIAVILNLMAVRNPSANWQIVRGIQNAPWFERYIWSYYWATTIMLTVGFGDIVPSNYNEAIWVIFIEIISCIAFSYNISCLGNLIGSIRAQGEEVSKNHKVFENLANKRRLSEELIDKIQHYIDQSVNVKTIFNIEEEKSFIQHLPQGYKREVQCETNRNLLKILPFFGHLMARTINKLSEHIERNIFFPLQTIKPLNSAFKIFILEKGEIDYTCKRLGCGINGIPVNTVKIKESDSPFLANFDFITMTRCNFEIKSKSYSIIHELTYENFKNTLNQFPKDYQYYCFLKDRSKYIIDEYESIPCNKCAGKHSNFLCPKLHFIPIAQTVILKDLVARRKHKNPRIDLFIREKSISRNSLKELSECSRASKKMNGGELIEKYESQKTHAFNTNFCKSLQIDNLKFKLPMLSIGGISQGENIYDFLNGLVTNTFTKSLKNQEQTYEEQVWSLALDMIQDYDLYFPDCNMKNIATKMKKCNQYKQATPSSWKENSTLKYKTH